MIRILRIRMMIMIMLGLLMVWITTSMRRGTMVGMMWTRTRMIKVMASAWFSSHVSRMMRRRGICVCMRGWYLRWPSFSASR